MTRETIAALLILLGSAFVLISALGLLRMPDLFMRMHAATKAGTLGVGLMLGALAVSSGSFGVVVEALAVIVFLLLTAPVAAHLLGRAGYLSGAKPWDHTQFDDYSAYAEVYAKPGARHTPAHPPQPHRLTSVGPTSALNRKPR